MNAEPHILSQIRSSAAEAQIVEWIWPSPMDVEARESRHMLEMSLPPFATDGAACFPDIAPDRYSFMGAMFLRPAGIALRARSAGGRIRVVRCAVDPDRFAEVIEREIEWSESELRVCLHLRSETLRDLFQRLRGELVSPGLASATLVEAYTTALIIEAARTLDAGLEGRSEGRLAGWQYRRITERIAEEIPPPSVSELARLCGVSSRHLLRLYRNLAGESVIAHIERAQAQRAKALLDETDLPLKTIAARLGFAHTGSFSTAFRRATGMTAREYRQRRAAGEAA